MNPALVISREVEDHTFYVSENIKSIHQFLKQQDYFENISKICHEEQCFAIDVHDLDRSIEVAQNKMLRIIEEQLGEEKAIEANLKGFSITKILTR